MIIPVVSAVMYQNHKILLGKMKGKINHGLWVPPGGKIERFESNLSALKRELKEETGCDFHCRYPPKLLIDFEDYNAKLDYHFVGNFYLLTGWVREPMNMEPEKCYGWQWVNIGDFLDMKDTVPGCFKLQQYIRQNCKIFGG